MGGSKLPQLVKDDPSLEPYAEVINKRVERCTELEAHIVANCNDFSDFTKSYTKFGLHIEDNAIVYREWAPGLQQISLYGDFNNWDRWQYQGVRGDFGHWTVRIPFVDGKPVIQHMSKFKVAVTLPNGQQTDRLPVWAPYVAQMEDGTPIYEGRFWNAEHPYKFQTPRPPKPDALKIYEVHIGVAAPEPRIGTYREFADNIVPYIKESGYNTIQMMAVQEHAYYASFGYQVTSFFAPSSRFGTPDDLKYLVDKAHAAGLTVLLDLVHSHASKNTTDGLNEWDGTDHHFFHSGGRGNHDLWDSRLFNYSHIEVLRFLLSNLRYWIEEYMFDGFRFDGVTSILYRHHGNNYGFSGAYHEYFNDNDLTDPEALAYLMLANKMLHERYPFITTIAEDVSGIPGLCRPVADGGVGFDARLAMAMPDLWIKLLKEKKDEDWNMGNITFTLMNRRKNENTIAYAESHDQALVGDKTISFWLMDAEMYTNMSLLAPETSVISRGMALHKMIRLITFGLGGEGILCFMGNEFGHPEYIDFPREGNGESFKNAYRQWNLPKDHLLRYGQLAAFDKDLQYLEGQTGWLAARQDYVSLTNEGDKMIVFERACRDGKRIVFIFNFHPNKSYESYPIPVPSLGDWHLRLSSDEKKYGGHENLTTANCPPLPSLNDPWCNRPARVMLYVPSRTCCVLSQ